MEHGMMHVQMARSDAQYMKQNYQAIVQFQQKFQATLNQSAETDPDAGPGRTGHESA